MVAFLRLLTLVLCLLCCWPMSHFCLPPPPAASSSAIVPTNSVEQIFDNHNSQEGVEEKAKDGEEAPSIVENPLVVADRAKSASISM